MPNRPSRLYLDHAATSFPKPLRVLAAMQDFGTRLGVSPGRGQSAEVVECNRLMARCRERLNTLFNGENAEHIVFTLNATDALNIAVKGLVRARRREARATGGRVEPLRIVTTAIEHNSLLRPLRALEADGEAVLTVVDVEPITGRVAPSSICNALGPDKALVAIAHASNITGVLQPAAEIGRICRERGALFLLDAAQSAGHVPIDVRAASVDVLVCSGHKGLLGPHGTGVLYIRPGVEALIAGTREGGTGSMSESEQQPDGMPQKFESGTPNAIGIVGLSEGVAHLLETGMDSIRAHESTLMERMLAGLRAGGCRMGAGGTASAAAGPLRSLQLFGPATAAERVGTFSFVHEEFSPLEFAMILEERHGIIVRAGLHCAARAHAAIVSGPGLANRGGDGSFRASLGWCSTAEDVDRFLTALHDLCGSS